MNKNDLAKIALIAMASGLCVTTQLPAKEFLGMSSPKNTSTDANNNANGRNGCNGKSSCSSKSSCSGKSSCSSKGNKDNADCPTCGKQKRMTSYSANKQENENTIAKKMEEKRKNLLNG